MSYQPSHRTAPTRHQPTRDAARIETLLIDEEFDDFPDRDISAICECLPDYRNF
jgi:hypothetical protein